MAGLQTTTQARTDVLYPSKTSPRIPQQSRAGGSAALAKPSAAVPAGINRTKPFGAATSIVPKHQGRSKSAARQAPTCSASKSEESEPRQTGFSSRLGAHPPRLSRFLTRLQPPPRGSSSSLCRHPALFQQHRWLQGATHPAEKKRDPQELRPLSGLLRGSSAVTAKRVTLRCPTPGEGTVPLHGVSRQTRQEPVTSRSATPVARGTQRLG